MRVLFTTSGAAGHLGPLLPFARAVRDRGGETLVAARTSEAHQVIDAGLAVWPFADADDADRAAVFASLSGDPSSPEANVHVVTEIFAGLDVAAALPRVLEAVQAFRPDVVVSEACEFAGGLAAEAAGLPWSRVAITLGAMEDLVAPHLGAALAPHREHLGLPADPGGERVRGAAYLSLVPPALEDPAAPGPAHARRYREEAGVPARLPDWWDGGDAPLVYFTLGTVAPGFGAFPGLYRAAIDALAPLPIRLLVTTGRGTDPAELGPLPANVRAERWVPQADVLPEAAAVVCHGGSGSVRAALCAGVPLAVLPMFADQSLNAARVAAVGAGVAVQGPHELAGAVRALLEDPGHAAGARAIAADARALPPVSEAVDALRALAPA